MLTTGGSEFGGLVTENRDHAVPWLPKGDGAYDLLGSHVARAREVRRAPPVEPEAYSQGLRQLGYPATSSLQPCGPQDPWA